MYGCESWSIKKAEHQIIDAFELWYWILFRIPWSARRSKHSVLKEISPEYSSEGLMMNLKFQYFGYLMRITDSLEKTLMMGKFESGRRRGRHRMRCLDGITNSKDMNLSKLWCLNKFCVGQGSLMCCSPWGNKESDTTEQLNWIITSKSTYVLLFRWDNCLFVIFFF